MTAASPFPRAFIVSSEEARTRLDVFLARVAPEFSRAKIQALIRDKFVSLNEKAARPRDLVRRGDRVRFQIPPPAFVAPYPSATVAGEAIALSILFEDEDLLVLDKPAGISVHPGAGRCSGTLVNVLLAHSERLSGVGAATGAGVVCRLSKETSVCM